MESGVCGKKFDKAKINFKFRFKVIFILFNYLVLRKMDKR